MARTDNEFASSCKKTAPVPPPYHGYTTVVHARKSLVKSVLQHKGHFRTPSTQKTSWDSLFDEGYRADVVISTDHGGIIYAHANVLGIASPVFRSMLKKSRRIEQGHKHSIVIRGVPAEAVHVFIRFLYSSCYEEEKLDQYALQLLVLSHAYAVPHLKQVCEQRLEQALITSENAIDIFQLALLCDAPRLGIISHRFILKNFKAVSATEGWTVMKKSHPVLEEEILESANEDDKRRKERMRKVNEREVYVQLYEAMEALIHICRDGCHTIGPHDKDPKENQDPCHYMACKRLEQLLRHFAGCKRRTPGGCVHCKRIWQLLELHSHLCADSNGCRVPLCRNFKQKRRRHSKKDDMKWRILVKKIVRSKSITGAPFFSMESA